MHTSWFRRALATVGIVGLAAFTACSSDAGVSVATTAAPVLSPATTTVAPPASDGATTTPATEAPTTTALAAPGGWAAVDPTTIGAPLAFPCCASDWFGIPPSPPLPAAGAPLADGIYRIDFEFPSDFGQPVTATVTRFELCSNLPVDSCEDPGGFTPDDLGVADAESTTIQLSIDGSLTVLLGGFNGSASNDNFVIGHGADLAELVTALDADYQTAVLDPAAAGIDADSIVANLVASPAYGFAEPAEEFSGSLAYTHNGSPPLLFQALPGVGGQDGAVNPRGSDVIGRISLVVSGGAYTITTYAGFYS